MNVSYVDHVPIFMLPVLGEPPRREQLQDLLCLVSRASEKTADKVMNNYVVGELLKSRMGVMQLIAYFQDQERET